MDTRPVDVCPAHTNRVFDLNKLPRYVDWAAKIIELEKPDALVACGHSGIVLGGALSYVTRTPLFAVRKHGEPTVAASGPVSGIAPHGRAKRWIWLDDFFSSGKTFRWSANIAYNNKLTATPLPIACILYSSFGDEDVFKPQIMTDGDHILDRLVEEVRESNRGDFSGYHVRKYEGYHLCK